MALVASLVTHTHAHTETEAERKRAREWGCERRKSEREGV
jgi:hypothetical protein